MLLFELRDTVEVRFLKWNLFFFQACGPNPYDPYFGGMMAAYGQPLVQNITMLLYYLSGFCFVLLIIKLHAKKG